MQEDSRLYEEGRGAMGRGDWEQAALLLKESAALWPHHKALELLGECLAQLDRLREAIVPLAAATTLNRGVRAPALLADTFLRLGERHDAEAAAQLALRRDPNNRMAQRVLETLAQPESGGVNDTHTDTRD